MGTLAAWSALLAYLGLASSSLQRALALLSRRAGDWVVLLLLLPFLLATDLRPAALDLLRLCAFLAPDDIPLDMIAAGRRFLPWRLRWTVASQSRFGRVIAMLERRGVVAHEYGSVSVPESVQEAVRCRLEAGEGTAGALELRLVGILGQERPLARDVRKPVEHPEDALEAEVRHPDVVEVGVDEGDAEGAGEGKVLEPHLRLAEGPVPFARASGHDCPAAPRPDLQF